MTRPSPQAGLLSAAGWSAAAAFFVVTLLPALPEYRTAAVGVAIALFSAALISPGGAFLFAVAVVSLAGFSALVFGHPAPVVTAPAALAAYFAGVALRGIYDLQATPNGAPAKASASGETALGGTAGTGSAPLLALFRTILVAAVLAAAGAYVATRSGYLLVRGVPPPRIVNVFGTDAAEALTGIAGILGAVATTVGFYRAATVLSRDARGRRTVDLALVLAALVSGGFALAQKLGAVPYFRAERWQDWERAQATFTDPSAAGVAAALLITPLLARAATGSWVLRALAACGFVLLIGVIADAGSRAGLVGAMTASVLFLLWTLTRLAAGSRPGLRRRVAGTIGALAILFALALATALSWPTPGSARSALLLRIEGSLPRDVGPLETASERLVLYQGALGLFRQHPVSGAGLGLFRFEFPNVATEALGKLPRYTDYPPSFYLGVLAETGLAGGVLLFLLFAGVLGGIEHALVPGARPAEETLRAAGAATALAGLLVVFLFGSHLVYPEVAAFSGILVARLPFSGETRTERFLSAVMPVAIAGALVLLLGGVFAKLFETWGPESAFLRQPTAGLYPLEREPDGRPFRWSSKAASWWIDPRPSPARIPVALRTPNDLDSKDEANEPIAPALVLLPVRNARPDGGLVFLDVYFDDVLRGRVPLPHGNWQRLELAIPGPGALRLVPSRTFRPRGGDSRTLGIEVGEEPLLAPLPPPGFGAGF